MQLDLNNLLEEIYSWKTLLKGKDEKIESLQNQITKLSKQNKILEGSNKTLLIEIAEFNNAVSALHVSISRLEDHEAEKRILVSEKKKLEDYIEEQKKLHQKELAEKKIEIERTKQDYKKETETELLEVESKASAKHENYLNIIKEKDSQIFKLEEEISRLKNEKNQDVLKVKLEYEERINKMKNRLVKTKGSNPLQDDFKKDDIFRQKYIKIEKESREEAVQLKKQIEELQSQIVVLKSQSNTQIHPLLYKTIPIINSTTNCDRISYDEEHLFCPKRLKYSEDHANDKENAVTNERAFDSDVKKHNLPDQTTIIKPVKKKLFNVDLNYF